MEPYRPETYDKFYVDDSVNDLFAAIKFYLIGTNTTDNALISDSTNIIKRKLKISRRAVTYNDIAQLAALYKVCVFVWDFDVNTDWLTFGDVFMCGNKILLFKENDRYGYLLRVNKDGSASVRRSTRTSRRPPRRYGYSP